MLIFKSILENIHIAISNQYDNQDMFFFKLFIFKRSLV